MRFGIGIQLRYILSLFSCFFISTHIFALQSTPEIIQVNGLQNKTNNAIKIDCVSTQIKLIGKKIRLVAKYMGISVKPYVIFHCTSCDEKTAIFLVGIMQRQLNLLTTTLLNNSANTIHKPLLHASKNLTLCTSLKNVNTNLNILLNKFDYNNEIKLTVSNPQKFDINTVNNALLDLNNSINQLLSEKISSGLIFENINYGIRYAEIILRKLNPNTAMPNEEKFSPFITNQQVFTRLVKIFKSVNLVANKFNLNTTNINIKLHHIDGVTEFDSYMLSQITLSILDQISLKITDREVDFFYYMVEHKVPSDNFQRLSVLEELMLKILETK